MQFNTTEEIIDDIRKGKMVIILDDEDRENEGDFVMASQLCRPEDINFMARYGRGLICMTMTREQCEKLRLPQMVNQGDSLDATSFTLSIEAAEGVTTGISAADRATTVRAAVAADAKPADIVQPGHVFPLRARTGGVLTRAGHTEGGCDLARLAGLEPSAVIVEILNDDGSMARAPDLFELAEEHNLKIGTIADLIHYRIQNEKTVERISECLLPTRHGDFRLVAFQDSIDNALHLALVKGEIKGTEPTLVRVHMQNTLCDLFGSNRDDCGWPLDDAMRQIDEAGTGVLVLLRQNEDARDLIDRVNNYKMRDRGHEPVPQDGPEDLRTYGIGAQILADLGVHKMLVMSAPKKIHGLAGFDLEIVDYVYERD